MDIFVIGAGVVGVTSAWYLAKAGHRVTVIEKLHAPAEETSFANGGQVSVGHTEPWAQPDVLPKIIGWLGKPDAPIQIRPKWDIDQWIWGLQFLLQCRPSSVQHNIARLGALGRFSLNQLQQLRQTIDLDYDSEQKGILHLYTNQQDFDRAAKKAMLIEKQGIERKVVSKAECIHIEPALAHTKIDIVGGTYTSTDESGDTAKFTRALAKKAEQAGVLFLFNSEVVCIATENNALRYIDVIHNGQTDRMIPDQLVVAAGYASTSLFKKLGIRIPVYPLKGYSATFEVINDQLTPSVSLTDEGKKMVFSRFGNRYRAAGMAELRGGDKTIDLKRAERISQHVNELFPNAMKLETVKYWSGLRPATPSNVPYIGKTPIENVFINTGHGTLGWTLSCGSAALLTSIMSHFESPLDTRYYQL